MSTDVTWPAEQAAQRRELWLAETVARRFYLADQSKMEIAAKLGISRFRVARLLDLARRTGIVTISVAGGVNSELSSALESRFRLRHAAVVTAPEHADDAVVRQLLGAAAADLLSHLVTADDVLGLGWARSVLAAVANLSTLAPCPVVQLSGAQSRPDVESDSIELVRNVARIGGGRATYFYAPMITTTAAGARALADQPDVMAARVHYDEVTVALVGIGGWNPPASTLCEAITAEELRDAERDGVYADLSGVLIDHEGRPARTALRDRIIGISAAQLRAVSNVVAIAYGDAKVAAARAAIRGGYVDTLVTDAAFARALLADQDAGAG